VGEGWGAHTDFDPNHWDAWESGVSPFPRQPPQSKTLRRFLMVFVSCHHWPFDDPAKATGTEAEVLACFRRVRDEMRRVFEAYAAGLRDG
jgi:hypothetical protein